MFWFSLLLNLTVIFSTATFAGLAYSNPDSSDYSFQDGSIDAPNDPLDRTDYLGGSDVPNNSPATSQQITSSEDISMSIPGVTNSDMTDSGKEEVVNPVDEIARCGPGPVSNRKERREIGQFCDTTEGNFQLEQGNPQKEEAPSQGTQQRSPSTRGRRKTTEPYLPAKLKRDENKCPPDIYGTSSFVLCSSDNRYLNVIIQPNTLWFRLTDATPCRFYCVFSL